mmetsp:Transcript_18341/g.22296  ORF Transcript_18341/g.22296 Transcript_18341/m.22296 type:complete len:386 (+) Transcript_18341:310-1467(+)
MAEQLYMKVVVLGDPTVGKTSAVRAICGGVSPIASDSSVEHDTNHIAAPQSSFHSATLQRKIVSTDISLPSLKSSEKNGEKSKTEQKVRVQFWDCINPREFRDVNHLLDGSFAVLIAYDLCSYESFLSATSKWLNLVLAHPDTKHASVMLVGCKSDEARFHRSVELGEVEKIANENNCGFAEISAKEGVNIDLVISFLTTRAKHCLTDEANGLNDSTFSSHQRLETTTESRLESSLLNPRLETQDVSLKHEENRSATRKSLELKNGTGNHAGLESKGEQMSNGEGEEMFGFSSRKPNLTISDILGREREKFSRTGDSLKPPSLDPVTSTESVHTENTGLMNSRRKASQSMNVSRLNTGQESLKTKAYRDDAKYVESLYGMLAPKR